MKTKKKVKSATNIQIPHLLIQKNTLHLYAGGVGATKWGWLSSAGTAKAKGRASLKTKSAFKRVSV